LAAVVGAGGDGAGAVGVVGDDFAAVAVGVVPVCGVAVGVWAGGGAVWAAAVGVAPGERMLVAVLAGTWLAVPVIGVPFGVAAGVSASVGRAGIVPVPFGVIVTVPPGVGLVDGVPFGVAVMVPAGVGLVRIVGMVIGAAPGAFWRSVPTVVSPCWGDVLPTSAATGRRAATSTTVIAPIARTKTSAATPATLPQRIGRRMRCGRMTTRSIAPVCGLKRVWMRARARWSEWV
jgi:hypothetical protein